MQYNLALEGKDVDLIFQALGEVPAKVSRSLLNNIEYQIGRQNETAQEEVKKSIVAEAKEKNESTEESKQ